MVPYVKNSQFKDMMRRAAFILFSCIYFFLGSYLSAGIVDETVMINVEHQKAFQQETIPPNWERIQWGKLPNGFEYAVMENPLPEHTVTLRLFVKAGSVMEQENQQGIAHFLEHMAFNGSRHFEKGELV